MSLAELKQKIKNDPETKDLEVSGSDLLVVGRYLEIRGTIIDGYKPVLKTSPYVEIIYLPTEEKINEKIRSEIKQNLAIFDSDIYLQDASLENFKVLNGEREKVLTLAKEFIENYSKTNYVKGLYLYGGYKTGKTYALSMIARELAKNNINVLLVFMPDLVRNIRQGISDGDLEHKINLLKQAEVLMFDDIGGENFSAWFRDEILLPILQYRLAASLPTFFSSNLEYNKLVEAFVVNRSNEHDYVKGVRLIQRIKDLTTYVKLDETIYNK